MKYKLLTIIIIVSFECYSQKNQIEKYITNVPEAELKGAVKSVAIYESINKLDTTYLRHKIFFNKNKTISKRYDYFYHLKFPVQIVTYDKRGRIIQFERKYDEEFYLVKQYFRNKTVFPDSINFYTPNKFKFQQFRNYFKNNQVIKQEHYLQDTLRAFQEFHYDSNKRLSKIYDINTKYGFGMTFDKSFTKTVNIKYLNPNDTITFKYFKNTDTLITYKYSNNKLAEIKKVINSKKNDITIFETYNMYNKKYLHRKNVTSKWKDSSNVNQYYYNENGDLSWEYSRLIRPSYIISNLKHYFDGTNKTAVTRFETFLDNCGNWTKKIKYLDDKIESITLRNIEYFNKRNCSNN